MNSFVLGCPCGHKIKVNTTENRKEIRCSNCKRYIKVPDLGTISPKLMTTQTLISNKQDQTIGKILARKFRIESHIADGAMGRVYKAIDLILKKPVAIKILKLDSFPLEMRERYEKRFLTEARIGLELSHSGIVPVRSVHRLKKGTIFFVMDLCPGQSLRNILIQKKKLPVEDAIEISKQLLLALQVAHEKGIAHRDIKPGNIMVEYTNEGIKVRVLDFGVAKVFSEMSGLEQQTLTKTGYIIGTTRYMAPEQILSKNVGGHTDIYAVGALLYHMISGTTPFSGTRQNVLKSTLRAKPMSLRKLCQPRNIIPPVLDAIVTKSLEKNPLNRFKNAQEFAEALDYNNKGKVWQNFLILRTATQQLVSKLDKKIKIVSVASIIVIIVVIICFEWIFPAQRYSSFLEEAKRALAQKKYDQSYVFVQKAEKWDSSYELKMLKNEILLENFYEQLRNKKYKEAQYYLETLVKIDSQSKIFEVLNKFFQQEKNIYTIENMLEGNFLEEALKILESSKENELQQYLKEERINWIKNNQQYQ